VNDPRLLLIDILERSRRIAGYIADGRETFEESVLVQDAVLRNLEVIGEAAKGIDQAARERWSDIPWRRMAGLRDVVIHACRDVDLDAIWTACTDHIPDVAMRIETILRELGVEAEPPDEA
jgi:uncharacterized protein with HEPN domain